MDNETLRNLIRRDQLQDFFQAASQIEFADKDQSDELVLLEARYQKLMSSVNRNEISTEYAEQEHSRIRSACLEFIRTLDLPESTSAPSRPSAPQPHVQSLSGFKKWILVSVSIIMVSVFLVWQFTSPKGQQENEPPLVEQDSAQNSKKDTPSVIEKQKPPAPTKHDQNTPSNSPKIEAKKQGSLLKVSGNHTTATPQVEAFIAEVLLEQGIITYTSGKNKSYASAIDCRFSIDKKSATSIGREDASSLTATLTLNIRQADKALCFSRRFPSKAQIIYPEDDENAMIQSALESLRQDIKSSGIKPCNH